MKIYLSIIVGIVVVAATAFFLLRGGEEITGPAVTALPILATTLAPDMTLTVANSINPLLVASTTEARVGDTLATSHNGRGLLQERNGTVTILDYDTKLTLEGSDGVHMSGFLGTGTIWARVEKVFGKGEYYKIKTQNAVAVVRGTSFGMSYKEGLTTLQVATGTVGLMPLDKVTGEPIEDKEILVLGGNKAITDDSGTIHVFPLSDADKKAPWYLFNNPSEPAPASAKPKTPTPTTLQTTTPQPAPKTIPQTGPASSGGNTSIPTGTAVKNSCASFSETSSQTGGSLKLTSVSPPSVSQSKQDTVTLIGEGFMCVTTITIGKSVLNGESDFVVASNSSITFSSNLLSIGTFDIVMNDTLGNTATLSRAITITQ